MHTEEHLLHKAQNGDITAFHTLFAGFQKELRAFIYRMVTDRRDAEDLTHDTFVRAFDKLKTFEGNSSLKTWVFAIASRLCLDFLRKRKRWETDSQDRSRVYTESTEEAMEALIRAHKYTANGTYEIREHIDFCFTCMAKTLPIEQQLALVLKDMYQFTVKEIAEIIGRTAPAVKHLLHDARKAMIIIFDQRCALVSKKGACYQCSEINGFFNPKQNQQEALMRLQLVKEAATAGKEKLYRLRAQLAAGVDPLNAAGSDLHEVFMQLTRKVEGEIDEIDY